MNKIYPTDLPSMVEDGFTERWAKIYLQHIEEENNESCFSKDYCEWAHSHGFFAESASSYGLTENNVGDFLSDYDYYKVWPLNSWTRIWINDKLTLKYMLADSPYGDMMPKYYFYSTPTGLKRLLDAPQSKNSEFDDFCDILKTVGAFACKPCNGTTAIGFFKLSYADSTFYIDNQAISPKELESIVCQHPNYVFTEYITSAKYLSKYGEKIHTLRLVTLNTNDTPSIVGTYLRFPNKNNGDANFSCLTAKNIDNFNLCAEFDSQTGFFGNAKKIFFNRIETANTHPDTGELIGGCIEQYDKLYELVLGIASRFNTIEWMGFDIGVTDNGFKLMEINSHPGIKYMQIFKPFLKDERLNSYFDRKLSEINNLSQQEKVLRNRIIR